MTCKKWGTQTTRRTHDEPKPGKTMWYAWYFHCLACGWLYMPGEAIRPVRVTKPKTSKGGTNKCHQCHAKFANDRELRAHTCAKADRIARPRIGARHGPLRVLQAMAAVLMASPRKHFCAIPLEKTADYLSGGPVPIARPPRANWKSSGKSPMSNVGIEQETHL